MDERELTRRFLGEPLDDPTAKERARARLIRHTRGRRGRIPVSLAAAALMLVLVAALVWSATLPRSAAAEALGALAEIQTDALAPGPGEYLHRLSSGLRTESSQVLGSPELLVQVRLDTEQWIAADGSGERRSVVRAVSFPSQADEIAWSQPDAPPLPEVGDTRRDVFEPGEGPLTLADDVPLGTGELLEALRTGELFAHGGGDVGALEVIGELLAQGNLPHATRAALLRATAELEGIELDGAASDQLGRTGEGFSIRTDDARARLIFDPDTGTLLARETYELDPSGAWRLISWEAFTGTEIASAIG